MNVRTGTYFIVPCRYSKLPTSIPTIPVLSCILSIKLTRPLSLPRGVMDLQILPKEVHTYAEFQWAFSMLFSRCVGCAYDRPERFFVDMHFVDGRSVTFAGATTFIVGLSSWLERQGWLLPQECSTQA